MSSILEITKELHLAFRFFNEVMFDNELPEPAITIQSGVNRKTMGWCSTKEIWRDYQGKYRKYEINIAAEYLCLDFYETMDTLLHEMVHLYCKVKGIKDTSRGGTYHNKRFKEECLRRGFYYASDQPDQKNGWAYPKITEDTKKIIDSFPFRKEVFTIARATFGQLPGETPEEDGSEPAEQERNHSIKWICENCGITVRSTKVVRILCGDCNQMMIESN